jgi:chromosome segregation ATPase
MKALPISRSRAHKLLAMGLVASITLAPAAWPTVAAEQSQPPSLAEIARKEAERRKTVKETKTVITTKDMPESARKPASTPAASEGGAHPGSAASPGSEQKPASGAAGAASATDGEGAWRARITQARENLRRNEVFLEALQTRINSLTNDSQSRDDPFQRAKLREERLKSLDEMERLKADIEGAKKQIADIEEEARKAGVPPGWLR